MLYCYEYLTVITLWSADAEQEAIATAGRGSWQSSNTCGKQCSKNTVASHLRVVKPWMDHAGLLRLV